MKPINKNSKPLTEHKDKLGRLLNIGDCVAYPQSNSLIIGTVKKLNPIMIGVAHVGSNNRSSAKNKYPQDCVKLDGPEVTMFLLRSSE